MKQFILFIFVFLVLATSCTEQEYKDSSNPTAVKSVSLNKTNLTLTEGESFSLSATVLPEDAYDKSIIWSTTDELIAAVSDDGTVLAKKEGNAVITATSHDGGKSATCLVKVEAQLDPSITIGATHISCISAVLSGKANLGKTTASDLKMGIMYSKSSGVLPSTSTIVEANDIEAEYYYSVQITELDPNTTYYYRSFVYENGNYTLGKTKSFVTKDVKTLVSVLAAEKVSSISAKALAKVELTDVIYEKVDANGFVYGTRQDVLEKSITSSMVNDAEGNKLEVYIKDLNPETTYWYSPYIILDGKTMHGDTTSFTTKDVNKLIATYEATEVGPTEATLNGMLDLTDCEYSYLSYGFSYSEGETNSPSTFVAASNLNEKNYSIKLSDLLSGRLYSFAASVQFSSNGSIEYLGGVKTFTTNVVKVESVSLNKNEYTFNTIGNIVKLKATILPASATDKSIIWTSSNERVATVDATGIVSAIGNGSATITVTTNDHGMTATCAITVSQWVTSISLNKTSLTPIEGEDEMLIPTIKPDNAADKTLNWTSSDTFVATVDKNGNVKAISKGRATITATANDGSGATVACNIVVSSPCPSSAVDMGITTGDGYKLYWATSNLSETGLCASPEDYGDYYAWGETEAKSYYYWSTYKFRTSSSGPFSKYSYDDNKTILEAEDDVAHVKLGGKWRTPTYEEWAELYRHCTWELSTRNGVNGYLVTSKTNGNSIFLPKAGYHSTSILYRGEGVFYWSSSLLSSKVDAYSLMHNMSSRVVTGALSRSTGASVRPASE